MGCVVSYVIDSCKYKLFYMFLSFFNGLDVSNVYFMFALITIMTDVFF